VWGCLSDDRTDLSITIAAGPRQRSYSRVRVTWESRPYFTVSDLRLPFLSPSTTRRATVEVLDPVSTRDWMRSFLNGPLYSVGSLLPGILLVSYVVLIEYTPSNSLLSPVVLSVVTGILCSATCYLVATCSLLFVITDTSVYLAVAHQRTSGSDSTVPAFRRHVTIWNRALMKFLLTSNFHENSDSWRQRNLLVNPSTVRIDITCN
jgi:hypothetical protein